MCWKTQGTSPKAAQTCVMPPSARKFDVYCVQKLCSRKDWNFGGYMIYCCLCSAVVGSLNSPACCKETTQRRRFPWCSWQCASLGPKNWVYFTFSQPWKINVETNLRHSIGSFHFLHHKPSHFSIKSCVVVLCRIVSFDGVYENLNMWLFK